MPNAERGKLQIQPPPRTTLILSDPTQHKGVENLALLIAVQHKFCRDQDGFAGLAPELRHNFREIALDYMRVLARFAPSSGCNPPDSMHVWLTPDYHTLYPNVEVDRG